MKVELLTTEDVLPIRRQVLWPDKPVSISEIENEHETDYIGITVNAKIVCVTSAIDQWQWNKTKEICNPCN